MMNSFFGLEMGRRALEYFRQGMDTAGHNISNADVEGYSRQRVDASSTDPFAAPGLARPGTPGQIGTGVKVDAIRRLRDDFLDLQFREESTVKGYWDQMDKSIETIELYISEPNGASLQSSMNDYWTALQELHKHPGDSSVRENMIQKTNTMVDCLDQIVSNYEQYRSSLNEDLESKVIEANDLIDQISALNTTISEVKGVGGNPNDLYDRRDVLAERLCGLIDADVSLPADMTDGDYKIDLDGKLLVQGSLTRHLVKVPVPGNEGYFDVQVEDNVFEHVDRTDILLAGIDQKAAEGIHTVEVDRLAREKAWKAGGDSDRLIVDDPSRGLDLRGSFSLHVGSSGTRSTSVPMESGVLLKAPADSGEYIFRLASGSDFEKDISIKWNDGSNEWEISDPSGKMKSVAETEFKLEDIAGFINDNYSTDLSASVSAGGDRLTLASTDDHLLSITDVKGDVAGRLGMANDGDTVTIEVTEKDSLETIRNRINGVYGRGEDAPDRPEEWLHAAIDHDEDGYYLTLESNSIGEACRINVTGDGKGSTYVARSLGFLAKDSSTAYLEYAEDARFTFDNRTWLSVSNQFREAREISVDNLYRADELGTVSEGIDLQLKGEGKASITVRHHVAGGRIKALMEARDDVILDHLNSFDEIAYQMSLEMNALHYSGHGAGDHAGLTGVAFYEPIALQRGAAHNLAVNGDVVSDSSLIATAGDDGKGHTLGSGDGSNVLRMAQLKQQPVLVADSASFDDYYEAFVAKLGVQGSQARTVHANQDHLLQQIDGQRQSTMGVNIDEEMMGIMQHQNAFNAMSRYITTVDEMLDKIINGMGLVGR